VRLEDELVLLDEVVLGVVVLAGTVEDAPGAEPPPHPLKRSAPHNSAAKAPDSNRDFLNSK
jgi:hypothetical protein